MRASRSRQAIPTRRLGEHTPADRGRIEASPADQLTSAVTTIPPVSGQSQITPLRVHRPLKNALVQPYFFFGGRCEEALDFYQATLGAHVELVMRYQDSPEPLPPGMIPPDWGGKIMHATFRIGDTTLMASDGSETGQSFGGFSLSLAVTTPAEAERVFAALAPGGKVRMPIARTFWSPYFGMLADRFGIGWMVTVRA